MNHTLKKFIVVSLLVSPLAMGSVFAKEACRKDKSAKKECKKDRRCCTPQKGQKKIVGLWTVRIGQKGSPAVNNLTPEERRALAKFIMVFEEGGTCGAEGMFDKFRTVTTEDSNNGDSDTAFGLWEKRKNGKNCFKIVFTTFSDDRDVTEDTPSRDGRTTIEATIKISKDGCSFFGKGKAFIKNSNIEEENGKGTSFKIFAERLQIKKMKKRRPNCK